MRPSAVDISDLYAVPVELIERYSAPVPRYTSYPTAVNFHPGFTNTSWLDALTASFPASGKLDCALYVHVPFCSSLCYYCACNKVITKDRSRVRKHLTALAAELRRYRAVMDGRARVTQIHWGGGSPNYLAPDEMRELFGLLREEFPDIAPDAELSVELDPRTTSFEQLCVLRDLGFRRMSLGVQDFDPEVQQAINRVQSFGQTAALIEGGRDAGFSGINVDLLYGLPLQTPASFAKTIEQVRVLRPDRIALYGYAHVTWMHKVQGVFDKLPRPSPSERLTLFYGALHALLAAGYDYIGIDHFALPEDPLSIARRDGSLHRNFMGYTTRPAEALLGFGMSAISTLPSAFAQNDKRLGVYEKRAVSEGFAVERGVARSAEDRARGAAIESILCQGQVDLNCCMKALGRKTGAHLTERLYQFERDGLIAFEGSTVKLLSAGRLLARTVASAFDGYLAQVAAAGTPAFSQGI